MFSQQWVKERTVDQSHVCKFAGRSALCCLLNKRLHGKASFTLVSTDHSKGFSCFCFLVSLAFWDLYEIEPFIWLFFVFMLMISMGMFLSLKG